MLNHNKKNILHPIFVSYIKISYLHITFVYYSSVSYLCIILYSLIAHQFTYFTALPCSSLAWTSLTILTMISLPRPYSCINRKCGFIKYWCGLNGLHTKEIYYVRSFSQTVVLTKTIANKDTKRLQIFFFNMSVAV